uniref:Integrase zinc-binding domain-containing protein n=1 Tax=Amphimedon queenslandica TaxID=400682 RepID=A0A1X7V978_AMPQE
MVEDCMVITRSQQARELEEEAEWMRRQAESGAVANPIQENIVDRDEWIGGLEAMDADLFIVPGKNRKTRTQRRKEKKQWLNEGSKLKRGDLPIGKEELEKLQAGDKTPEQIGKLAEEGQESSPAGVRYTKKNGLLYRVTGNLEEETEREQLVLPTVCRKEVLRLAHSIPLGGHLGQKKTTARVLKRFYWPGMFQDIKQYCWTCPECQRIAGKRIASKVPLVS